MADKSDMDDAFDDKFIGRDDELQAVISLFSSHHMHNGIYFYAEGGRGKTYLLRKIYKQHHQRAGREVGLPVDFFNTENHSKRGLQKSIMGCMDRPEIFKPYEDELADIVAAQNDPQIHPSVLTGMEKRADRIFIQCCQRASLQRELVLIFDTLERVQNQEAGRWLLEEFLAKVQTPKVILAGRPVPGLAATPGNIRPYELPGLSLPESEIFLQRLDPPIRREDILLIHNHTAGSPLIMNLLVKTEVKAQQAIKEALKAMPAKALLQKDEALKGMLVESYKNNLPRNKLLWIMAFLKRRFDLDMLRYVVKKFKTVLGGETYDELYRGLNDLMFVKKYLGQESHLLHDEVQQLLAECILTPENAAWQIMKENIYQLIVNDYYPNKLIKKAASEVNRKQYISERLGYLLDHDPQDGVGCYYEIQQTAPTDYDLEELLWNEMRTHLDQLPNGGKELCWKRFNWLMNQNLLAKAEQLAGEMLRHFPSQDDTIRIHTRLGAAYFRQGKLDEAVDLLEQTLQKIPAGQFEQLARVENVSGQAAFHAGKWEEALVHYARGFQNACLSHTTPHKISIYVNRAYIYSLQGLYELAEKQCLNALALIREVSTASSDLVAGEMIDLEIYALMNLGTVQRHTGEFALALKNYQRSCDLAEQNERLQAKCNALSHIGINQHLAGRAIRRQSANLKAADLARSCRYQIEAWDKQTQALEIAERSDWKGEMAESLNRLAKIHREIYHLTTLETIEAQSTMVQHEIDALVQQAQRYPLYLEEVYSHRLLAPHKTFVNLGWREKAIRLFELSALVAEEVSRYHRALDSLNEQLRIVLWIREYEQVEPIIARVLDLRGYDYQGKLYEAMVGIGRAESDLRQGRYELALGQFAAFYIQLANETSFVSYLLVDNLRDMARRIREDVPPELQVEWCNRLEAAWLEAGLAIRHPEMIETLENLRIQFLAPAIA